MDNNDIFSSLNDLKVNVFSRENIIFFANYKYFYLYWYILNIACVSTRIPLVTKLINELPVF